MCGGGSREDVRGKRPAVKIAGDDRDGDGAGRVGGGSAPPCESESPAVDSRADSRATGSSGGLESCILGGEKDLRRRVAGARRGGGRPGPDRCSTQWKTAVVVAGARMAQEYCMKLMYPCQTVR
jgi:hypothetical protein